MVDDHNFDAVCMPSYHRFHFYLFTTIRNSLPSSLVKYIQNITDRMYNVVYGHVLTMTSLPGL